MKQMKMEIEGCVKAKQASPPPPPPPLPPLPKFWSATNPAFKRTTTPCVTNQEIARFWRQKRCVEEEHLLAAIKAAARIRARNLTEEEYKQFEESLEVTDKNSKDSTATTDKHSKEDDDTKELRVGIKDWWTKSKYAYLNQPAIDSMDNPKKRTSTYIPNFCFYKPVAPQPASLGVF